MQSERGERLLDAIIEDVDQLLNPNGDECWHCGGEGATYDCIDGCCADPESGCDLCCRPCAECVIHERNRLKAIREEVIKSGDTDVATAWLKSIGRWHEGLTPEHVAQEIEKARASLTDNGSSPSSGGPDVG